MVDALAIEDDEGRNKQRYASGSSKYALIRGSPNVGTRLWLFASILEWIHSSSESNLMNWNILVVRGKERKIDYLSSGERNGISPNQSSDWGCRTFYTELQNFLIAEQSGKSDQRRWQSCKRKLEISWVYPEYGGTRVILSESAGTIP